MPITNHENKSNQSIEVSFYSINCGHVIALFRIFESAGDADFEKIGSGQIHIVRNKNTRLKHFEWNFDYRGNAVKSRKKYEFTESDLIHVCADIKNAIKGSAKKKLKFEDNVFNNLQGKELKLASAYKECITSGFNK